MLLDRTQLGSSLFALTLSFGLSAAAGCSVNSIGEGGPQECVGGIYCPAGQECVNGLCLPATGGDTVGDEVGSESSTVGEAEEGEGEGEGTTTTTTTGGECTEGTFACPCGPGDTCDPGLECIDGTCMLEGAGESTSTSGGGTTGGGTTTGTTGGGTTTGTTTGGEGFGMCGWSAENSYYDCGQMGEDPNGVNPIECPPGPFTAGAACPNGLTNEGCCEPGGTLWYCEGGVATTLECG